MKTTSFISFIFVLSSDDLGRLKTEINMEAGNQKTTTVNGKKIVYTYSSYGDVLQRQYFNVQRGPSGFIDSSTSVRTDRFGYTNLDWRNQCDSTNINGVSSALTYDAIGNPLTYRDGMQMTWQNGRQLKKLTAPNGKMLRFSYDLNGQRQAKIERSYGNVVHTTKYFYDGTKLAGEKKDDTIVWYDYDENGSPIGMRVNGLDYIFRKNLQGDITGIYDSSADLIVEYSYADAWGAGVTVSGSAASTIGMYNSFRYRGYYYDTESGLYYLNSRYYDPVACRFINADSQLNPVEGNFGHNLYSYCGNNPTNYKDADGKKPGDLFDSMDQAARDFALCYNMESINANREIASFIYSVKTKKTIWISFVYTINLGILKFNLILPTKVETTITKYSYRRPYWGTSDSSMIPINWFGLHNKVAEIHTHAAYMKGYNNSEFSSIDIKDVKYINYVVTPLGTVRKYDPSDQSNIIIFDDIPSDPNYPNGGK